MLRDAIAVWSVGLFNACRRFDIIEAVRLTSCPVVKRKVAMRWTR
jgi:hypothetical protein